MPPSPVGKPCQPDQLRRLSRVAVELLVGLLARNQQIGRSGNPRRSSRSHRQARLDEATLTDGPNQDPAAAQVDSAVAITSLIEAARVFAVDKLRASVPPSAHQSLAHRQCGRKYRPVPVEANGCGHAPHASAASAAEAGKLLMRWKAPLRR